MCVSYTSHMPSTWSRPLHTPIQTPSNPSLLSTAIPATFRLTTTAACAACRTLGASAVDIFRRHCRGRVKVAQRRRPAVMQLPAAEMAASGVIGLLAAHGDNFLGFLVLCLFLWPSLRSVSLRVVDCDGWLSCAVCLSLSFLWRLTSKVNLNLGCLDLSSLLVLAD
jgi:hypothetical protein